MTTVVGLDPSLTAFGLARICWDDLPPGIDGLRKQVVLAETWHRGEDGVTSMPLPERHRAIVHIAADVLAFTQPADLVVVEGASHASKSTSAHERSGLWWRVVGRLVDHDVPVVVVQPKTRAKWVTGNGNASKVQVSIAVGRLWPDVEICDDNEADALGLAGMAMQLLGGPCPFEITKYRQEALSGLRLPVGEAA